MIPREILKKIRQSELRTNRIVTETLAGFSFQPSPQFRRIPRAIENRNDTDVIGLDVKVDAVAMKSSEQRCLASFQAGETKAFRSFLNFLNDVIDFSLKFIAQPRLLFVIPKNRLIKLEAGDRREDDVATHAARRAFNRCLASARTCSHGMPALGFCRSSFARRSSSAFCSGVSSSLKSPNSKSMVSTSSRRSGSGIRRSSSRISVLLMSLIYFVERNAQLKIRHSSFVIFP